MGVVMLLCIELLGCQEAQPEAEVYISETSLDADMLPDVHVDGDSAPMFESQDGEHEQADDLSQLDAAVPDMELTQALEVRNVLLIVADDLGLDAITGFGFNESTAQTPNINL